MARFARVVVPGCPHHVTHRGNRGDQVFFDDAERRQYCVWLREYGDKHGLGIWAYCLMSNHVHLIAVPQNENALSKAIGNTHRRHSSWVNGKHGWTGHLWANRFFSTPMDSRHLWAAVQYVELNPLRAGLVEDPIDYHWSSARAHCGLSADTLLHEGRPFPGQVKDWHDWLLRSPDQALVHEVRVDTSTGRPCGSDRFVDRLEQRLGRKLTPAKRGPKPTKSGTSRPLNRGRNSQPVPVLNRGDS